MLHRHVYLQLLLSMVTLPLSATNYYWNRCTTPYAHQQTETQTQFGNFFAQKNFKEILGYIYQNTQTYIDVINLANGAIEERKIRPQHTFNQVWFDALCQNLSQKFTVTEQKTWLKNFLTYCAKNSRSYIPDDMLYFDSEPPKGLASNIAEQFKQHTTLFSKITEKNVETSYSNLAAKNMSEEEQKKYYQNFIFDLAHCGLIPIIQKLFSEKERTNDLQLQQAIAQQIQIAKLIQMFLNEEDFDTKTIDYFSNKSKTQYNLNLSKETILYIYNIFKNMRDSANQPKWGSNTFLNTYTYKNLYNQADFFHDLSRLACKTSFCTPENKLNAQKIWLGEEKKITDTILNGSIDEMEKFLCGYSFSAEYSQYEGNQKAQITVEYLKKAMELSCWEEISSHVFNVISTMLYGTQDHYSNALLLFQKILTEIEKRPMLQTSLTDLNKSFVQNLKLTQENDERKTHGPDRHQITYQTPASVDLVKKYKPINILSELQKTMEDNLAQNNSHNISTIITETLTYLKNILKDENITAAGKIATLQQTEHIIPVTKRVPLAMANNLSAEFVAQLASFEDLDFNTWMRIETYSGEIAIQLLPFLFNKYNNKYATPIMFVSYLSTCVKNGCQSCEDTLPHFLVFLKTVQKIIQDNDLNDTTINLICKTFKEFNSIINPPFDYGTKAPDKKATEALNEMFQNMTTPLKGEEYFALVPTGGLIKTATDLTKNINKLNNNYDVKKIKNLIKEIRGKQTFHTLDYEQKPAILLQKIKEECKDFYTFFVTKENPGSLGYRKGANNLMYH